jgi:MoxR-like ATPase
VQPDAALQLATQQLNRVREEIGKIIVGQQDVVDGVLICLLAGGHVLLEGVPGLGKTTLLRTLARVLHLKYSRIQFTPDLMPGDIVGSMIIDTEDGSKSLRFQPGPIFAHLVLADEINRATPKTQSALLEAMEEGQITVDGETHLLPDPFLVMATQNPIEYEGTFPLPEAQLDRFMLNISLGYPAPADEVTILDRQQRVHPIDSLGQILSADELTAMQRQIREVRVDQEIREYIVSLVTATRQHQHVYLGSSPRGSLALFRGSQAYAALKGRDYVTPDDVKALVRPALSHRLIIAPAARVRGVTPTAVLDEVLGLVPVPGGPGSLNGRR